MGCLGFSLEGSGVVVSVKRLETSKILFFQWNFNDFVVQDSNLVGRTSNSRGRDSSFVGPDSSSVDRDISSGGSQNRCQVLLNAPRRSQKLAGATRSSQELNKSIFSWFKGLWGGGATRGSWRCGWTGTP